MKLYSNCSESVFRFHTIEPEKMQEILQLIADEIDIKYDEKQIVPLLKKAKDYEGIGMITGCAGLGDQNAVIKVNKLKKFFTLNIGNNDISDNSTGWVDSIKAMDIKVEEAECDKVLSKLARDCTCGITYGFQSEEEKLPRSVE